MKIFLISIFLINTFVNSYLYQIPLTKDKAQFYVNVKIGKDSQFKLALDISLKKSLLPNPNCKICKKKDVYNPINKSIKIKDFQSQKRLYYNFTGEEYIDNMTFIGFENLTQVFNFISFSNISYVTQYSSYGCFELSFTNYNFNTSKKIFGFQYTGKLTLDIGEINTNIIQNMSLLKNYSVKYNENKTIWYIESDSIKIKNKIINEKQKIKFDITTNILYIPKKFFFEHIENIFPSSGKCQILDLGVFICTCDINYYLDFSSFTFYFNNNETFIVNSTDYIQTGDTSNYDPCLVVVSINYEDDYWVFGYNIFYNYYLLFNIDENIFSLYPKKSSLIENSEIIFILIFLTLTCVFLFFGMCKIYSKKDEENIEPLIGEDIENNNEENNNNENNNNENNNNENNNNENINNENINNENINNENINNENYKNNNNEINNNN